MKKYGTYLLIAGCAMELIDMLTDKGDKSGGLLYGTNGMLAGLNNQIPGLMNVGAAVASVGTILSLL